MRAAILSLALVLVGGVAQADAGGARSHFLSGLQLYSQGRWDDALREYQAAWVQWEDPELLLDMAECNRHLGKLDEAREQYRGFLERAPQSPLRGSVERQLARLDCQDGETPPPAELVAAAPAPQPAREHTHRGRAAMGIGIAGWAASLASFGLGIWTSMQRSHDYSTATTGLFMTTLLAGAGGTASFIVGATQAFRDRPAEEQPIGKSEAALTLRFPF